MLLLHQTGSVKIGETVRYTVTYTPAHDRILPPPPHLHLRIKNTCAVALRAAFIHGPYTLYVSSSPSNFHPNTKFNTYRRDGIPEFEPHLKPGGSWYSRLLIPEDIRSTAGSARSSNQTHPDPETQPRKSVTWIIEVASQTIFSTSASVNYEILVGRDEKSLSLGLGSLTGNPNAQGVPGQVSDHQESQGAKDGHHNAQPRGVFSRAIKLRVDDTASLWNRPRLPEWDDEGKNRGKEKSSDAPVESVTKKQGNEADEHANLKQKKIHLVVLTHGLHSNLGADMLYIKESIDEASKQAKEDAKIRRAKRRDEERQKALQAGMEQDEHHQAERENDSGETKAPREQQEDNTDEAEDEEEVIVRGFSGNAVRTEKGIKYLGKRLARWILTMTYPDQPFKPIHRSTSQSIAAAIKSDSYMHDREGPAIHNHSDIHREPYHDKKLAYKITSISFVAHSLGGLIQTYAIAYIQKHSPHFFDTIKPINFVAMATPFLGLSNENPVYVKMALDFGFVGRTGQDLGLTWRAPALARSGWGALVGGIGEKTPKEDQDAKTKPLLRILPTGPAHIALKKFRNRTLYSNVVNDGVVPLRTSCLLFLDWQGLGRVEKARRENGLVGTVTQWGWAELTGANVSDTGRRPWAEAGTEEESGVASPALPGNGSQVPQPSADAMKEDDNQSLKGYKTTPDQPQQKHRDQHDDATSTPPTSPAPAPTATTTGPLDSFLGFFRSNTSPKPHNRNPKSSKIYKRSQTLLRLDDGSSKRSSSTNQSSDTPTRASGEPEEMSAPPKTTIFESVGDIINPPLPPIPFIIDPSSRPRTIFHDRVYHPDDIPPPPIKRRSTSLLTRRLSRQGSSFVSSPVSSPSQLSTDDDDSIQSSSLPTEVDGAAMKVEEKIARAYHKDLSWRKVLVRLEPDAHNNMMVRRKFANAYGWPVVKHLCDTHFSDQAVALMRDDEEGSQERAKDENEPTGASGDEIKRSERGQAHSDGNGSNKGKDNPSFHVDQPASPHKRTESEVREAKDRVPPLHSAPLNSIHPGSLAQALNSPTSSTNQRPSLARPGTQDSAQWSDGDFMDSDDDGDSDGDDITSPSTARPSTKIQNPKTSTLIHPPQLLQHQDEKRPGAGWNWEQAIAGKGNIATSPHRAERRRSGVDANTAAHSSNSHSPSHSQSHPHGVHFFEQHDGASSSASASASPSPPPGVLSSPPPAYGQGHRRKSSADSRRSSATVTPTPLPPLVDMTSVVGLGAGAGLVHGARPLSRGGVEVDGGVVEQVARMGLAGSGSGSGGSAAGASEGGR